MPFGFSLTFPQASSSLQVVRRAAEQCIKGGRIIKGQDHQGGRHAVNWT